MQLPDIKVLQQKYYYGNLAKDVQVKKGHKGAYLIMYYEIMYYNYNGTLGLVINWFWEAWQVPKKTSTKFFP